MLVRPALLGLALLLAGCGRPLGEYRFERVEVVTPTDLRPGFSPAEPGYPYLLKVTFSSDTDLAELEAGTSIYLHADYCPFQERYGIRALGPFGDDRELTEQVAAGGGARRTVPVPAPRDPKTRRYAYVGYLVPAEPFDGVTHAVVGPPSRTYDVFAAKRDVCLRLDHPDHGVVPSRSNTFVVPAAALEAARRQAAARGVLSP